MTQATPVAPFRLHRRFDRLGRLYGDEATARLARAHVLVLGLGGVGSFVVESLARSGIGRLTLVDFDRVCVTNTNRQLQALSTTWRSGRRMSSPSVPGSSTRSSR